MPRLLHGHPVNLATFQDARESISGRSAEVRLGFVAARPPKLQRYGFLFPELQKNPCNLLPESGPTRDALVRLGQAMQDTAPGDSAGDSDIPSAYTYFGQFVDHDLTLETGSATPQELVDSGLVPLSLAQIRDRLRNLRTANLDLDSVYGLPAPRDGEKMEIGKVTAIEGTVKPRLRPEGKDDWNDVPRESPSKDPEHDRAALTGDPRNDENTLIAQLQVAFLRAHNALVAQGKTFDEASTLLRQHYQHVVLHDFLKRIADPTVVDDLLRNGNRIYDAMAEPFFLPLEFTVAAYRFGHSMVRAAYDFNLNFNASGEQGTTPATLGRLFTFTALSGNLGTTEGTVTLPENWIVEWERFVDVGDPFNKARRIDTKLVEPLFELPDIQGKPQPGDIARLAVRNLLRGYLLRLPTGQAVARTLRNRLYGAREIPLLTAGQILEGAGSHKQRQVLRKAGFLERTPLWYYLLAEAAILAGGQHLGPVGSTLVAEVLVGLVRRSDDSILRTPCWTPTLPARSGDFDLADLLRLAGVLR